MDDIKEFMDNIEVLMNGTKSSIISLIEEKGEITVRDICKELNQDQSYVSNLLRDLREKDYVEYRTSGRSNYYSLKGEKWLDIMDSVREFNDSLAVIV